MPSKTPHLDEWFGPRHKPAVEGVEIDMSPEARMRRATIGGTHWRCEERLIATLDAFIDSMGEAHMPRSAKGRTSLYASVRQIVAEVGENDAPAFVRWACQIHKERRLEVKDPWSLAHLAPQWRQKAQSERLIEEWIRKPCPNCFTFHPPNECPEDDT